MHPFSKATAIAIGCLINTAPDWNEVADYVEMCRINLELDNAALIAGMMFAQPLIKLWGRKWKIACLIGITLGAKFTIQERFFLSDIIERVTAEFSLADLREREREALRKFQWGNISDRFRMFRNALVNVALQNPVQVSKVEVLQPEDELHVMIVDDSAEILDIHKRMVLALQPDSRISFFLSAAEAIHYLDACNMRGDNVDLILMDLNFATMADGSPPDTFADIINDPQNGFVVGDILDAMDSAGHRPPIHFWCKPLFVLVTEMAEKLKNAIPCRADGSIKSCDVVVHKPLRMDWLYVLLQTCCR